MCNIDDVLRVVAGYLMCREISYILLVWLAFMPLTGSAVVFYSTGDTNYNTTAPTGDLEGSGWQFQGMFLQYLGTPIAPHHFITAKHIGGSTNNTFSFEGITYSIRKKTIESGSDFALYEIDGTFPRYAPLYSGSDEEGKHLVVMGRGRDRGSPVTVNGEVRGWKWGNNTKIQRWGKNRVSELANAGSLLVAEFNYGAEANECMLSGGDSGGGLFIEEGGEWKLAAVNYAVGPLYFNYVPEDDGMFSASMFDYSKSGKNSNDFYYRSGTNWYSYYNRGLQAPCSFYSSRISSRYSWITNSIPDFDRDVDGLPDWWETLYGGDPISMERDGHLDTDDFTNYEEWLADTVPTDSNSFLRVTAYTNSTSLVFSSSENRTYQVQYRTDLAETNPIWQTEADWFEGDPVQTVQPVSTLTGNRFYRVRAKPR